MKTQEHRDNISRGRKGIKFSQQHRINIGLARIGMKFSDEHRRNLSLAHMGKGTAPRPKKVGDKISAAKKGTKLGYHHSEETKTKISESMSMSMEDHNNR